MDDTSPLADPLVLEDAITWMNFSATGQFLFTIHPAHAVYVWSLLQTNEPPALLRPGATQTLTESGQDGSVIVSHDPNSPIRVRALADAAEVSLHLSSLKIIPLQAWFDGTGRFIILEGEKQRAQVWDAATGLPVTPVFQSRYTTNEADYRTVRLPTFVTTGPQTTDHGPSTFAQRASADKLTSDLRPLTSAPRRLSSVVGPPSSVLRSLAELLSGSRLDGTGGWKPLEVGEIVERWNQLTGRTSGPTVAVGVKSE